jgi:hypothetical protein
MQEKDATQGDGWKYRKSAKNTLPCSADFTHEE